MSPGSWICRKTSLVGAVAMKRGICKWLSTRDAVSLSNIESNLVVVNVVLISSRRCQRGPRGASSRSVGLYPGRSA